MVQRRWNPAQLCYFALPFLHQSPQDHRRAKWGEMPPSVPVASHHLLFCQTPSVIARILRWLPSVHVNTVLLATVNVECRPMKVQLAVRIVTPAPVDVSELRKGRGGILARYMVAQRRVNLGRLLCAAFQLYRFSPMGRRYRYVRSGRTQPLPCR